MADEVPQIPDPLDECCAPDPCKFHVQEVAPINLDISEVTEGTKNGQGVYDKLLTTLRLNLSEEFSLGHISEKEYSNILINTLPAMLQHGITLSLSKARQSYELDQLLATTETARQNIGLVEAQKRLVLQQGINAETEGEILRSNAAKAEKEDQLMQLELTLKKEAIKQMTQTTANSISEGVMIKAQIDGVMAETDIKKYQVCQLMPEQKKGQQLQNELITNQAVGVVAQTAQTNLQSKVISYDLASIKPVELELLNSQVAQATTQTAQVAQQTAVIAYELQNKIPAEVLLIKAQTTKLSADTALANEQLILAGKEILLRQAEIALKTAELEISSRQLDLYEQKIKTEKAQIDGTIIGPGSVLDASIKLQQAQTGAYEQDQIVKATKLLMDSFSVQYQEGDATGNAMNLQDDRTLGKFVQKLGTSVGLALTPTP